MKFTTKTVQSRPGLSQEEALSSLQDHPLYRPGTKISAIRRRGDRWVAELLEPKIAGELEDEDGDEGGPESGAPAVPKKKPAFADEGGEEEPDEGGEDPDAEGPEGPPGEGAPGRPKGSEKAEVAQLLHIVQQIADALGIAPSPEPGMGGPDDLGPGPDGPGGPPAPPHGGDLGGGGLPPMGAPKPGAAGIGAKLKPGEVPNKPGTVPVGAPAFASAHTANPGMGGSSIDVPMPTPGAAAPAATGGCPHGYPNVQSCPQCQAQGGGGMGTAPGMGTGGIVGRVRSFTASKQTNVTLAQAKYALEAEFGPQGYRVEQIRRDGDIVRALLVA